MNVPGKIALVAGATSGLGLARRKLSGQGAKVGVFVRRGALAGDIDPVLENEAIGAEGTSPTTRLSRPQFGRASGGTAYSTSPRPASARGNRAPAERRRSAANIT